MLDNHCLHVISVDMIMKVINVNIHVYSPTIAFIRLYLHPL